MRKDADEAIARLVASGGAEPPTWLVASASKARAMLGWTVKKERDYPGRKELRARLKKLIEACKTVRATMFEDFDLMMISRAGMISFSTRTRRFMASAS